MIFCEFKAQEDGWVKVYYTGTWENKWDFMLDALQRIIVDFGEELHKVAYNDRKEQGSEDIDILAEVKSHGGNLRECESLKTERGILSAAGISSVLICPYQIVFFNHSPSVRIDSPYKKYFDEHGEHIFDNFLNSVEIKAYCDGAVRDVLNTPTDVFHSILQ